MNVRQKMKALACLLFVVSIAQGGEAAWRSKSTLIVVHPAHTALPEKDALEREVVNPEFKKRVLSTMSVSAKIRVVRPTSLIEITVSASSRDACEAANRALTGAIIAFAKKDPKSRIEIRVLDEASIAQHPR